MLARYKIYRGTRPSSDPQPVGIRQDTRWRRKKHPLHPNESAVKTYLDTPSESAWRKFRSAYLALLRERFGRDQTPFDQLAKLATSNDVFIGCSCPTKMNPRVDRCHTYLALQFMKREYPELLVELPPHSKS